MALAYNQAATAPRMYAINDDEPIRIGGSCWSYKTEKGVAYYSLDLPTEYGQF